MVCVMRSKIKYQTSSCNKARSAFLHEFVLQSSKNTNLFQKPNCPGGLTQKLRNGLAVQNYILVFPVIITLKKMESWSYWRKILLRKAHILFAKYTIHYRIDYCGSDSVDFVWRLLCTFIRGLACDRESWE